jgi:sulfate-transporting ATPase
MATGALYALSALGVLVVYRSSGVLNLANGAFAMVAGYTCYSLSDGFGLPGLVAIVLAAAVACLLSFLVFVVVMRPLAERSTLTRLVATLALYLVVQSVILMIYGPFNKVPTSFLPTRPVDLLGIRVGLDQVIILVLATVITAALWAVYRYTRFGLATTAVSENPRALASLGRDVDVVRAANWAVAGLLGGVAGVFIAPITQLTPGSFLLFLAPSLAVAVLVFWGRSLPGRSFVTERLPRVGSGQVRPGLVALVTVVLVALAYTVFDDSLVLGSIVLGSVALIALSQVLITGYAGQLSLVQMSMAGLGGLIAAQCSCRWPSRQWPSSRSASSSACPLSGPAGRRWRSPRSLWAWRSTGWC